MVEYKDEIVNKIILIVKSNMQVSEDKSFDYDTNLIDSRFMTSLSFIKMLRDLEKGLNITHELDQITLDDFSTVNKIIATEIKILKTEEGLY